MTRDNLHRANDSYQTSSEQQIGCPANLKAQYRELRELRERVRASEARQPNSQRRLPSIKSKTDSGISPNPA